MKETIGSAIIAAVAALSSVLCTHVGIPVWVMFIGWIAFVASGMQTRIALPTFLSAIGGVLLGFLGVAIIGALAPIGPDINFLIAVFVIVFAALLASAIPVANLVVCYFIGMTTFFASNLTPSLPALTTLGSGLLLGILSGCVASLLAAKVTAALGDHAEENSRPDRVAIPTSDRPKDAA